MGYFNYHATAKKLIAQGKLTGWYFIEEYKGIKPALVLLFDDIKHPIMPIREHKWNEYEGILPLDKKVISHEM